MAKHTAKYKILICCDPKSLEKEVNKHLNAAGLWKLHGPLIVFQKDHKAEPRAFLIQVVISDRKALP